MRAEAAEVRLVVSMIIVEQAESARVYLKKLQDDSNCSDRIELSKTNRAK